MSAPDKAPFNVRCGKCSHVWTALYTPMPLGDAARVLKGLRCPSCASTSKDHFATEEAL